MFGSFTNRFIAIALIMGSLGACQKADSPTPASTTTPVVLTMPATPASTGPYQGCKLASMAVKSINLNEKGEKSIINGKTFYLFTEREVTYSYDTQGRINDEQEEDYGQYRRTIVTDYTYDASSLERRYFLSEHGSTGNGLVYTALSTLNSAGSIVSDSLLKHSSTTYAYDANGYMIRQKSEDKLILREIKDGNIVKETGPIEYSYDVTKPGQPDISNLFGKVSRNLLIRAVTTRTDFTGTTVSITNYRYVFDTKGRVSRRITSTGTDPTPVEVSQYTYIAN